MRRGILVVLALLAPLASACALNPPRIVSIAPGREATDVATNQAITITFDRAMNHESVEQRFGLSPALPGCSGSKNCHFAWNGNTLTFIHAHVNFEVSTAYRVSMHAGYADATGQQNGLEHSWRFITEGRPALTAVDPPDNATAVAPDRNIVLSFSRPMRADSMRAAVQLSPATVAVSFSGRHDWGNGRAGPDSARVAMLLDALDAKPYFDLGLRLGEGTGAALAFGVIRGAVAAFTRMATFASAGVSDAYAAR